MGGEFIIYRLSMTILRGANDFSWCFVMQIQIAKEFKVVVALYFVCINKIFCINGTEVY